MIGPLQGGGIDASCAKQGTRGLGQGKEDLVGATWIDVFVEGSKH
jgi:hypothetical protein